MGGGFRLTVHEADSPTPATPERVAALRATALLDDDDKIPLKAWEGWFKPAWQRREKKRAGGAEGNRRRWHPDKSDTDSDTDSHPESPSLPSVPTDRSVPTARDGKPFGDEWNPFLEAWRERFKLPPSEKQRSMLYSVIDARPNDAAAWCRAAPPGANPFDVAGYVLKKFRAYLT